MITFLYFGDVCYSLYFIFFALRLGNLLLPLVLMTTHSWTIQLSEYSHSILF